MFYPLGSPPYLHWVQINRNINPIPGVRRFSRKGKKETNSKPITMKKQPPYPNPKASSLLAGLAFLSFAMLRMHCFAQSDAELSDAGYYRNMDVQTKPWHFEGNSEDDRIGSTAKALQAASEPDNLAVIDGLYKAFANGDIPGALAPMDANIEWNEAESFPYSDRNPYIGPQAVLDGVFARIGQEWEYWNLTGIELHEMMNDKVLATLRYQAKYKKNGAVIDAQTAHFWTLKDGKITHFQQFTDTDQVVNALAQ